MATEFERRPSEPVVERTYLNSGNGAAGMIALIVALAIGAFVFFTFYNSGSTPSGPTPRATTQDKAPPVVPATPPAKTTTPTPSTK
jgi:uncharacterized protein HemX